jgi:hypothetical protein
LHTAAGAETYLRFYIDRLNAGFSDPEAASLGGLSKGGCSSCLQLEESIQALRRSGQHVSPMPYRISVVGEIPDVPSGLRAFQFLLTEQESTIFDLTGTPVRSQPSAAHLMEILLAPVKDGWVVQDLAIAKRTDAR